MPEHTLLVVEDEAIEREAIRRFFKAKGYQVLESGNASRAEELFRAAYPEIVILDYALPDRDGIEVLRRLHEADPTVPVIILTGHGSIDLAVRAVKDGAAQFLTKPVELPALQVIVERLIENRRNHQLTLAGRARRSRETLDPFLGESAAIRALAERARRVAASSVPVLIQGETGAGKGLLASWIHENGPRATETFVDLNCAGLARELLETELFGHEKGAFTGAVAAKVGLFEIANRGTLFLDEIGDVTPEIQAKLLKVVEEQRFRRLGDVRDRQVSVRLIAATHHDLARRAQEGTFRSDLLYRINVIPLHLPPLRERGRDVITLANLLLARCRAEIGRFDVRLSPSAERALETHHWPGNIRELRNVIERAVLLGRGAVLEADDLEIDARHKVMGPRPDEMSLKEVERRHIIDVLASQKGEVAAASSILGLSRSALYQKIRRHKIPAPRAVSEARKDRGKAAG
ncbi:MAG: sigma-54-dependent Fis family transcriptional regulator [Vicinamibacteria bacterium]|nr:sigma-54-dependent Fis family transcriptional regulator [Vicinamibacteria bacterium]